MELELEWEMLWDIVKLEALRLCLPDRPLGLTETLDVFDVNRTEDSVMVVRPELE